jgi:RNA polymerase sigma-70 factor (ECF subfamily)
MGIMRLVGHPNEPLARSLDYSETTSSDVYKMSRFERLYEKYRSILFRYCLRQVGRRDLAEDIASEAFLTLYQRLEQVEDDQLPAWLFTVAKNKAMDYWRHQAVTERYEKAQVDSPVEPQPEIPFELLLRQNKALKPVHRTCLILRYVHDLNRTEIARQTGLNETQIKGHLQYALKLLRQSFSETRSGE